VGLRIARRLGWNFLDSGGLYRALAFWALHLRVVDESERRLSELAAVLPVELAWDTQGDAILVLLDGQDVGSELRTERCGEVASRLATLSGVRQALLDRQRAFRQAPGLVADGRDMGTVVFPDASLKIFLTASAEERAHRRYKQLMEKGFNATLSDLAEEVRARDQRDATRAEAPLRAAADAVTVDTSGRGIRDVVALILRLLSERVALPSQP
jgi:cytidylate kinase